MKKLMPLIMVLVALTGCEKDNNRPSVELINSLLTTSTIYAQVTANESILIKRVIVNDSKNCDIGYATQKDYEEGIFLERGEKYAFSVSDCPLSFIAKVALSTDKGELLYSFTQSEEELVLNLIFPENGDSELLFVAEPLMDGIRLTNANVSGGGCKLSDSLKEGLKKDYINNNGEPYHLYFDDCSLEDIQRIVLTTEKRTYQWIK